MMVGELQIMFKSPKWAALIDVKMADGIVQALSPARLGGYGLPPLPPDVCVRDPLGQAPAGAVGAALVAALAPGRDTSPGIVVAPRDEHAYGALGIDAVARHARNVVVCEAMYPVLHMLEVVMRNAIHRAFSSHFGAPDWYEQSWLRSNHRAMVNEAKHELSSRGKPHEVDRVIAQLGFGFWCGMFHYSYEEGTRAAWPALLDVVLPNVPKSWKTRAKVQKRVEEARALRNRVFHHESITFYTDLRERHRHLVEVLGWFSPQARRHVEHLCRFGGVYGDNLVPESSC